MTKSVASSFSPIEVKKSSSFQLKLKSVLKAITLPVLLLIACEYLVRAGFIEPYLLPAPVVYGKPF
jgi:sulfonate transport system permease protein